MRRSVIEVGTRHRHFHVVNWSVGRMKIFGEKESAYFLDLLGGLEAFSGIQVLSYCVMSNHFHLLLHVPPRPGKIPDDEVLRRMRYVCSGRVMAGIEKELKAGSEGAVHPEEDLLDRQRRRMFDLSEFMKDLQVRFSRFYNENHDRRGTLWENRYRIILVDEDREAVSQVASWIELNPVRAGLANHPGNYRWSSFHKRSTRWKSGLLNNFNDLFEQAQPHRLNIP